MSAMWLPTRSTQKNIMFSFMHAAAANREIKIKYNKIYEHNNDKGVMNEICMKHGG